MEFLSGDHTGCEHPERCVCPDVWVPLDVEGNLRTADGRVMGVGRPAGLHLGTIIHMAKVAAGEVTGEVEGDQPGVRVQEGFLWEAVVEYIIAGAPVDEAIGLAFKRYMLMLRGGLVTQLRANASDGRGGVIHGTPDALDTKVPQLESYKSTRRTLRKARTRDDFASNFWIWVMQEAGYCHMVGVDRVRWIVWWQAGDYSRGAGSGPRMLEATARFSHEELRANWEGVCRIASRVQ